MMNYLESDGRVASSEVRRACSQNVVMPRLDRGIQKIYIKDYDNGVPLIIYNHWIPAFAGMTKDLDKCFAFSGMTGEAEFQNDITDYRYGFSLLRSSIRIGVPTKRNALR